MDVKRGHFVAVFVLWSLICSFNFVNSVVCTEDGVVISTHYGEMRGLCKQANGKNVTVFYGVPYAKPPVGALRWTAPTYMDKWDGVFNATSSPNWCPQDFHGGSVWSEDPLYNITAPAWTTDGSVSVNEDCLYLNIYVPGEVDPDRDDPLSVIVWIHGGDFRSGSANEIQGEILAVETGVIVITINYRIGVFGFLSFDHELARGNYGLYDQTLALDWVEKNSRYLGADRSRVTIAGASTGGKNVLLHLVSPESTGLFSRAIIHSGAVLNVLSSSAANNKQMSEELSRHTKCHNESVENMLNCMRNVNVSETFRHVRMIENMQQRKNIFLPVVDGEWLPDMPIPMADANLRPVDLLIGVVKGEGSLLEDSYKMLFNQSINEAVFKDTIQNVADPNGNRGVGPHVLAQYYPENDNPSSDDFKKALVSGYSDYMKAFTRWWADKMSASGGTSYMFLFNHQPSFSNRNSKFTRVAHGDDMFYTLGTVLDGSRIPSVTDDEKVLSARMMTAWASFVKTGKPDFTPSLNVTWPEYRKEDPKYMILSTRMGDDSVQSAMAERAKLFYADVIVDGVILVDLNQRGEHTTTTDDKISTTTTMPSETDDDDGQRFHLTMAEAEDAILALILVLIFVFVILLIIIIAYCIDKIVKRRAGRYETSTRL